MAGAKCDVCKEGESIGVACSTLGPISMAYCMDCIAAQAEPPWLIASTIWQCGGRDKVASWVLEMLPASLGRAKMTQEEFDKLLSEMMLDDGPKP